MYNKIKTYFKKKTTLDKELRLLVSEKKELLDINKELLKRIKDPRTVMETIFNKELKWFDSNEMGFDGQARYYENARSILDSKVFQNVKNKLIATLSQEYLKAHNPDSKTDVTRDCQMTINGIELLVEEFESISKPTK